MDYGLDIGYRRLDQSVPPSPNTWCCTWSPRQAQILVLARQLGCQSLVYARNHKLAGIEKIYMFACALYSVLRAKRLLRLLSHSPTNQTSHGQKKQQLRMHDENIRLLECWGLKMRQHHHPHVEHAFSQYNPQPKEPQRPEISRMNIYPYPHWTLLAHLRDFEVGANRRQLQFSFV